MYTDYLEMMNYFDSTGESVGKKLNPLYMFLKGSLGVGGVTSLFPPPRHTHTPHTLFAFGCEGYTRLVPV